VDSDGIPVIAMSVLEEGTQNGTMTDADGKYTITLTGKDPSLRYETLGYKIVTEKVAGRAVINVTAEIEAIALDAVVAIGYGTAKKRDLTTAISTVSTDYRSRRLHTGKGRRSHSTADKRTSGQRNDHPRARSIFHSIQQRPALCR